MKVRRVVVIMENGDHDAVEPAQLWHATIPYHASIKTASAVARPEYESVGGGEEG